MALTHLHSVNRAKRRKKNLCSLAVPFRPNSLRVFGKAALTRSGLQPLDANTARAQYHVPAWPSVPCGELCQLALCPCESQLLAKTQRSATQWSLFTLHPNISSENGSQAAVSRVDSCEAAQQHHWGLRQSSCTRATGVQWHIKDVMKQQNKSNSNHKRDVHY